MLPFPQARVGFFSLAAFVYATYLIVSVLVYGVDVPGYASTMATILFLGGINIFATGVLGEYLGRVHTEVKNRPLYVVRETQGLGKNQVDITSEKTNGQTSLRPTRTATR